MGGGLFHGARLLLSFFLSFFFTHDSPRRAPDEGTEAVKKQQQQTVRKILPISVERDRLQLGAAALTHL